jgi:hypothetical protein
MNGPAKPSSQRNYIVLRRVAECVRAAGLSLVWMVSAVSCTISRGTRTPPATDTLKVMDALERKICLTIGTRTYSSADKCESPVDRATYVQPLLDVYRAAPPVVKAYLCSVDRIYLDSQLIWNADFRITTDSQTRSEYRTIGVRRGLLERKVSYTDWASGWTQHWWTGAAVDRPANDPTLPRVESDLHGSSDVLFHLLTHEVGHVLAYDYRAVVRRQQSNKAFEPGEFGFLSWVSPVYGDSTGSHAAVAREPGVQAVRTLDFDGNVTARIAMRSAMETRGTVWDAGLHEVANWQPAPREGISKFLEQLGPSSFTTVFSTWRPEDDWTESFAMMMLSTVATRIDIVSADGGRIRLLQKVSDAKSAFAPKRQFIQQVIDRALTDMRARHVVAPDACFAAALFDAADAGR